MIYMNECRHPKESIVERKIRRRDGKEVLVRACAKCGRILEVICLKCGTRKWRNNSYTRKDGTHVERFTCPSCGKSISLAPSEVIANEKCVGAHEDLREVTEIKKDKTRIKVFKCGKCGEVEAYCERCGRWVWRHKTYTRKSDGMRMTILRCPECGAMVCVDSNGLPPRKKRKKRRVGPIDIEEALGLRLTQCVYCGGKLRILGKYPVSSGGIVIPRKKCADCGHTQSIVTLLRQGYAYLASCPVCGSEEVVVVNNYGRPKLQCGICGETFYFESGFETDRSSIPRKSSEEASRWVFPLLDTLLAVFASKYNIPPKTIARISMAARAFRKTTSYRFLESLMLSPRPFTLCRKAPDHATIQRDVYRIDISTLQQLVNFLARIVADGKNTRNALLMAIDSTTATTKSMFYPHNRASIKFHGTVDIDTRVILDIDFGWSVEDIEFDFRHDFFIAFVLGDKEYWVASFSRSLLEQHIVPVVSPKGDASDDDTLMVLRWLQRRHLKDLRRVRGIVEEIFSYLVPHSNVLASQLCHTMMVEILIRAIIWNTLIIGSILDAYVREHYGLSLTRFLGGKGVGYEAKLEPLEVNVIVSLIREVFGRHVVPSEFSKRSDCTWFLSEFCGVSLPARTSK